nr:uncharacterized protein LOC108073901 [Drosophila kikkawai]
MTTFSFYKCEGHSSYILNVSAEETDNLGQSFQDKQIKGHYPSLGRSVRNPEAFYNFFGAYTERIAHEARRCWQQMSTRQRARFGPIRSSKIIKEKLRLAHRRFKGHARQEDMRFQKAISELKYKEFVPKEN